MTTVFLDTETLGLDRRAPIWEFAAIRMDDSGSEEARAEFFIRHDPGNWVATLPESFQRDYHARYDETVAHCPRTAACIIAGLVTGGPTIAGSNPAFDMERLTDFLAAHKITPGWHYHPLDVPTLALGWLAAGGAVFPRPWTSDALSRAAGVEPADYQRLTAMGDVQWCRDLYARLIRAASTTGEAIW